MGINASHNGAVCLLHGDRIVVAIQEERLTRIKRQRIYGVTPALAIAYCLSYAGIEAGGLDMIVTSVQGRNRDPLYDVSRNPILRPGQTGTRVEHLSHHRAHAISAFALSGFADSAVLVIDGIGSPWEDLPDDERAVALRPDEAAFEAASLYQASGVELAALEKHLVASDGRLAGADCGMPHFSGLGDMYAAASRQIFDSWFEAGKVMGLAALGEPDYAPEDFFSIANDGFEFHDTVPRAFQFNDRWPQHRTAYQNLARSTQEALERGVLLLAQRLRRLSGSPRLCYAGGVALNGIANERLFAESGFDDIFIIPPAEDSGVAIGAAYWGLWRLTGVNAIVPLTVDALGRPYAAQEVEAAAKSVGGVRLVAEDDVVGAAVDLICEGRIIGWFFGGSELGPRALGQRSILCDPRRPETPAELNGRIKRRESFRPFAPAILKEAVPDWFETNGAPVDSPFMLRVSYFKPARRREVPAVVHADGSGRLQTLTADANGPFFELVERFNQRTGVPMVLNTSFNGPGEPIVETPADALRCMLANGLDACVFAGIIAVRS